MQDQVGGTFFSADTGGGALIGNSGRVRKRRGRRGKRRAFINPQSKRNEIASQKSKQSTAKSELGQRRRKDSQLKEIQSKIGLEESGDAIPGC